ncbi:MAG: glycosyltransferase, partial [Muribaculaceae bacterium]|nr:glycosyltransferase [Muribaculaceae bacterium]
MKVSVIIPIYNTGEYLRACIGSICRQTHRDLQIIMIDDGSAETTAAICDQIAASDHRITIVHKPNEGVSKARNHGLEIADGDVVCFVDSDDTIEPSMIEDLLAAMERD